MRDSVRMISPTPFEKQVRCPRFFVSVIATHKVGVVNAGAKEFKSFPYAQFNIKRAAGNCMYFEENILKG